MQSSRKLPSLFSWKGGQENPQRVLRISKLVSKVLLAMIMFGAFFMLSSSAAFAGTSMSPVEPSNGPVSCTDTWCGHYAAKTHCIDSFRMLQDDPIYNGVTQVGSLRWWYSDTCKTYWSQVFSTNCANIDDFVAEVYIQSQPGLPAAADFGFDKKSCSFSGRMYYDPNDALEPGGGIHFTDSRSWIYY